jgi:hypothetical protein
LLVPKVVTVDLMVVFLVALADMEEEAHLD